MSNFFPLYFFNNDDITLAPVLEKQIGQKFKMLIQIQCVLIHSTDLEYFLTDIKNWFMSPGFHLLHSRLHLPAAGRLPPSLRLPGGQRLAGLRLLPPAPIRLKPFTPPPLSSTFYITLLPTRSLFISLSWPKTDDRCYMALGTAWRWTIPYHLSETDTIRGFIFNWKSLCFATYSSVDVHQQRTSTAVDVHQQRKSIAVDVHLQWSSSAVFVHQQRSSSAVDVHLQRSSSAVCVHQQRLLHCNALLMIVHQ